jgi:hypothetical protein
MKYFDILLWFAVPLSYLFWIFIYPKLVDEDERISEDI